VLKSKGAFKGVLVLAPLRPVYSVWPKEVEKWSDFKDFSVGILHGDNKHEVLQQQHDIYVMNYEGIDWLFGPTAPDYKRLKTESDKAEAKAAYIEESKAAKARMKLLLSKVDTLVFDELSKMKKPDTNRFKSIKPWLGKFARRWGLTGSPAPNGLMDLFGQAYVLDLGRALGQYITHYRNMYFMPTGFGGYDWKLQQGADEKIYAAMRPLSLRMEAEDYLDMPKVIPVTIEVELPPAARKMYDDMEDELFAELGTEEFVAVNAASASTKCAQIAQGALYKDKVDPLTGIPVTGKREWKEIHNAKLVAVQELLEELQGQPLLGGYHFGHDLERIVKTLGKQTPHCDVNPKEFERLRTAWNKNELASLWGHPASMGHGNNMQEGGAQHIVWFNIPWDYELYDQMVRRIRRQGNTAKVIYVYHIVCKNTIDELKMVSLHNKDKTQKSFLNAVKSYRSKKNAKF
jgi:SNF2 family DNA or RNA helicase